MKKLQTLEKENYDLKEQVSIYMIDFLVKNEG
jgi:hypothetical protein